MASITSAGIGSGLNVESIISSLMAAESTPLTTIKTEKTAINTKLSIYGIIKNSFASLQTATDKLSNLNNIYPLKATSSNSSVVSATASSAEAKGSYSLTVSQLAQKQSVAAPTVTAKDSAIGTGSIRITLGSYDSGTNLFNAKSGATPVDITIDSSNQTLSGIKDAINSANSGVTASIVNDGSGYRLVMTSNDTGAENGFKVTVTDGDGSNTNTSGLSWMAYDPTAATNSGKNAAWLADAQDAKFKLNNIDMVKSSNTVTDAVEGLSFTLSNTTSTAVNLDVSLDSSTLQTSLNGFVTAYNTIKGNLKDQQQKDATLAKETTPSQLERQLRSVVRNTGAGSGLSLSDIGISIDQTGSMSLNSTKLTAALTKDPSVVEKLFADTGSASDSRVTYLGGTSATKSGTYAINVSTAYNGSNTVAGTINGVAGSGLDNLLNGADGNDSAGLAISLASGASGSLGTVTFNKGLASTLSDWIDSINAEGGSLASRTTGLNNKITRLNKETDRINDRLTSIEANYRKQFSALDTLMANMSKTSSYLTQQLSALSNSG